MERRLDHLEGVLAAARVIDRELILDRVTPGARIQLRDLADGEVSHVVVSVLDCHDGLDVVSPYSALGEMLETARAGEVLEYDTPNGRRRAVEVVEIGD